MLDLDHFKRVNDRHGHAAGDQALRRVCELIAGHVRGSDVFARVGGEEFALLLPETTPEQAETAALDELLGLGHDYHEQFAPRIEATTVEDVRRIARVLLRECVITVTTDKPELVKAKEGVRTYDAFAPVDLTPRGVQHDSK